MISFNSHSSLSSLSPVRSFVRTLLAIVVSIVTLCSFAQPVNALAWGSSSGSSSSIVGYGSRGVIPSASFKSGKAHTSAYSATASQAKGSAHASRKGQPKPAPTAKPIKPLKGSGKGSGKASSKPSLPSWQSAIGY